MFEKLQAARQLPPEGQSFMWFLCALGWIRFPRWKRFGAFRPRWCRLLTVVFPPWVPRAFRRSLWAKVCPRWFIARNEADENLSGEIMATFLGLGRLEPGQTRRGRLRMALTNSIHRLWSPWSALLSF